jgi:uncharacterized membrane protein YphA (DoxX/SURF4 family)
MDLEQIAHLLARVLFSVYFIGSGVRHLTRTKSYAEYAKAVGNVPMPTAAVIVTGLMLLAGGLCILLGWHPRVGALLLVAFLIPVAIIIHHYWTYADPMQRAGEEAQFWKNITLAGAALYIAAKPHWPWPYALGE